MGAGALLDPDCDLHVARAAAAMDVPYIFTNQGSTPMEECAAAMGESRRWVQLYWSTDEALVDSLIQRAEAIDAGALVVTLDTTTLGWRPQDLNLGSLPFAQGQGIGQYTSDPRFRDARPRAHRSRQRPRASSRTSRSPSAAIRSLLSITRNHPGSFWANLRSPVPRASVEAFLDIYSNPGLSWDHLATLRERPGFPSYSRGSCTPTTRVGPSTSAWTPSWCPTTAAVRSTAPSPRSTPSLNVRGAVSPEATVLMDSGIRTGADVFTALALGADAVLLGRPYMYGVALAGQRGVEEVISNVLAELDLTMSLTGVRNIGEINRNLLVPNPPV